MSIYTSLYMYLSSYLPIHLFSIYFTIYLISIRVHDSLVVSVLDCRSRGLGFKSRPKFGSRFLFHLLPLANSAMMSKLTAYSPLSAGSRDGEREDWPPSLMCRGPEAKNMKSLTLHTYGWPIA